MFGRLVAFAIASIFLSLVLVGIINASLQGMGYDIMPWWLSLGVVGSTFAAAIGWQFNVEAKRQTAAYHAAPRRSPLDAVWNPTDRANALAGVQFAIFFLGLFFFFGMFSNALEETRLFTDSRYEGLWEEVEAYHFHGKTGQSLTGLADKYDPAVVADYFEKPVLKAAHLPNQDAALLNVLVYSLGHEDNTPLLRTISWLTQLLIIYVPIAFGFRLAQEYLSSWFCLGKRARQVRQDYFEALRVGRLRSAVVIFAVTVGLAIPQAVTRMSTLPDRTTLTLLDVIGCIVLVSYFSGLYMRLVSYCIEVGLLMTGMNPLHSIWDELIALVMVAPVLWLVYKNPLWTVVSTAIAGLGSGLMAKWLHSRRRRRVAVVSPTGA